MSALHHRHSRQDELVYVLEGIATLVTDDGEQSMGPGSCVGFKAGGCAHQFENRGTSDVVYLEAGDRASNDAVDYPHDDLEAVPDAGGRWLFTHEDAARPGEACASFAASYFDSSTGPPSQPSRRARIAYQTKNAHTTRITACSASIAPPLPGIGATKYW